jgi:hypothetical protein
LGEAETTQGDYKRLFYARHLLKPQFESSTYWESGSAVWSWNQEVDPPNGLWLAKHHGRMEVSSVVGKGSEFELVLPFSMPAAEVAAT